MRRPLLFHLHLSLLSMSHEFMKSFQLSRLENPSFAGHCDVRHPTRHHRYSMVSHYQSSRCFYIDDLHFLLVKLAETALRGRA